MMMLLHFVKFFQKYILHTKNQPEVQAFHNYFVRNIKKYANFDFIVFIIKHSYNMKYKNAFVKIVILKTKYLKRKGL